MIKKINFSNLLEVKQKTAINFNESHDVNMT